MPVLTAATNVSLVSLVLSATPLTDPQLQHARDRTRTHARKPVLRRAPSLSLRPQKRKKRATPVAKKTRSVVRIGKQWSVAQLLAVLLGVPKSTIGEEDVVSFLEEPIVHMYVLSAEDMAELCVALSGAPEKVFSGAQGGVRVHIALGHWRAHTEATTRVVESLVRLSAVEWVDELWGGDGLVLADVDKVGRELRSRMRKWAGRTVPPALTAPEDAQHALHVLLSALGLHTDAAVMAWAAAPIIDCAKAKIAQVASALPAAAEVLPTLGFRGPVHLIMDKDEVTSGSAFTVVRALMTLAPLALFLSGIDEHPMRVVELARSADAKDGAATTEARLDRNTLSLPSLSPDMGGPMRLVVERRFWPEAERVPPKRLSDLLSLSRMVAYAAILLVSAAVHAHCSDS